MKPASRPFLPIWGDPFSEPRAAPRLAQQVGACRAHVILYAELTMTEASKTCPVHCEVDKDEKAQARVVELLWRLERHHDAPELSELRAHVLQEDSSWAAFPIAEARRHRRRIT